MADTDFTPDQLQQMRSQVQADKTLSPQERLQAIGEINKALGSVNPSSPASTPPQPEADPLQTFMDKTATQKTSQPMDIGPALGGVAQGTFQGLTGHIYNPTLKPEEQPAANAAKWVTDLGADIGLGLGGAAAGGTAGAALGSVVPGAGTALGAVLGAPIGAGLAVAGHHGLINYQDQLHEHPGQPVNLGAVAADAGINGLMGAIAPGEGSLFKKALLDSAIGGTGGAALNASDQYFNNNGHVDAGQVLNSAGSGALAGALIPIGMRALPNVAGKIGRFLGKAGEFFHGNPTESVPTESANAPEPTKDPVTGMLTVPNQTQLPEAPPAGPGVLTGKVEYKTEAPETTPAGKAPWDDDNDGGGSPAPLSPENGQPVQQQPAEQPGNITSALEQLQQRRALLQQMQQQGQFIEAGQQANQAAAGQSPENVQAAQSAVEQMRARQQELLRQQQDQAIQQKADEIHSRLTNYERVGAKSQANKLKAEIAEQAASHPDPIQRAAYQRALDKYAPKEEPTPEPTLPPIEDKPVEQPTVKLSGTVSKEGTTNEPKTVKLFRGVVNGRSNGLDNDTFWSPERETAALYSKGPNNESGQVLEDNVTFNNLFETQNWMTAKKELGLPYDTSMPDLLSAIKAKGYDGVTWRGAHGPEYIKFPAKGGVNEPQGPINNPQGQASQPEGQQHAQEQAQEVQPSGQQEPAEQASQETVRKHPYETDFVPSGKSGNTDLGELPELHDETDGVIHAGATVRMHEGHEPNDFEEGYGAAKIRTKHAESLKKSGFENDPAGMVENILESPDRKYYWDPKHQSLVVVKPGGRISDGMAVELVLDKEGHYYSVKTMGHWRDAYFKSKRELKVVPAGPVEGGSNTVTRNNDSALASDLKETPGETGPGDGNLSSQSNDTTPKKKVEPSTEEALNAIYPEKPYPKEGLFDHARPQGTDQREHFLEAQAHKAGKFLSPAELENHGGFSEAYNKLTPDEKEKLHAVADAIINKKKVKTGFYNPGTETEAGVLTKRSGHGQELYSPKGLSITKKGDIVVHGYNENAEISSRRLDRFSGKVEKTTEEGYNGLYKHPSDINESETFHPADSIVEQVANPILKKQVMGKPIVESDYRAAASNLRSLIKEAAVNTPELKEPESIQGILDRLPEPVKEWIKDPKGPCH